MRTPALLTACLLAAVVSAAPQKVEMAGYLIVPTERVNEPYEAGFSIYAAAWPRLSE